MKFKHLFLAAFAAVAMVFTSCDKEEDLGAANVSVEKAAITLEAGEASETITFTATRDWTLTCPDWIAPSAKSGKASTSKQTVTISVEENKGNDRTGDVVISIGLAKATVSVTQKGAQGQYQAEEGDGSKDKPFNVAQAFDAVKNLTWTDKDNYEKVGPYYVRGKIVSIKEAFSAEYGNAQFTISDDGTAEGAQFTCYRVYYLENKKWVEGNTQIQVGDVAVIYGELMYYGTGADGKSRVAENVQKGAYLYSLNGETKPTGGVEVDYNNAPAKTVAEFISAADATNYYKLTGKVSKFNATYCSFDLTDDSGSIYVYNVLNKDDWASKVANDATVVLAGKYKLYKKADGTEQHEVVDAYILSCEGGSQTQDSEPKGSGTLDDPYNAAKALEVAKALAADAKTETDVYVAGKIASVKYVFDANYGTATFDISDDGSTSVTTFTCYSVYYLNNRAWVEGDTQIAVGDDVIICGKLFNYKGTTPETASKEAYIYSLNGETDGGEVVLPVNVKSFKQTAEGFSASWDAFSGATGYVWMVFDDSFADEEEEEQVKVARRLVAGLRDGEEEEPIDAGPLGYGYTEDTSIEIAFGYTDEEGYFLLENFEIGQTYYILVMALGEEDAEGYYEEIGEGFASFVARDMSNSGNETTVTFTKEQLAAAACKGAKVDMDGVISFTNDTDYGSNTVTELRIYKGKTLTISAAGATITLIEFTCSATGTNKQGPGCWGAGAPEGYTYESDGKHGTWSGSEASVAFTATDNQVRIEELTVTYVK